MKPAPSFVAALTALVINASGPAPAAAQGVSAPPPDVRSMIDALTPSATRSMRNLVVRQKPDEPAAAASAATAPPVVAAPPAATAVPVAVAPAPAAPPTAVGATLPSVATTAVAAASPAGPAPSLSLAIQFESNSSQVRPESGSVLGNLVAAMQSPDLKGVRFAIEGHTDARGLVTANQQLSQLRADEVRLYLIALGVHPARLKAVGKGSSEPANPKDPMSADNRRVRVVTVE